MKVKLRLIGDKIDSTKILLSGNNLQLGDKVWIPKFPATKDVGVLVVVDEFDVNNNKFQICVKNEKEEVLGRGEVFRSKILSKSNEGILAYNVNKAYFENRERVYIVELWNGNKLLDTLHLSAEAEIYNIYENLDEKGRISFSDYYK